MFLNYNLKRHFGILALVLSLFILIDNENLYSQNKRNVVFEEFSEVWCGPCASLSPMLKVWLENHPDYIPIHYYSYFSINGQQKQYDINGYTARKNFYNVPFYPYARINAELAPNQAYPGYPTDTTKINQIIDTMTKTSPIKIDIQFNNQGKSGTVKVEVYSDDELTNKQLFVMIVEKQHTYAKQANGMTNFHHIMRQTLPSSGEKFSISKGETKSFEYSYLIADDLNFDLYAVALVQDINTKYIFTII